MPTIDYRQANKDKEPFEIILEDRTVTLPKVFPAKVVFDMEAEEMEALKDAKKVPARDEHGHIVKDQEGKPVLVPELSDEQAKGFGFNLVARIFGQENWDAVVAEIGIGEVQPLIREVMAYYGMGKAKPEDEEAQADPKAPTMSEEAVEPLPTGRAVTEDEGTPPDPAMPEAGNLADPELASPSGTVSDIGQLSMPTSNASTPKPDEPSTEQAGTNPSQESATSSEESQIYPMVRHSS